MEDAKRHRGHVIVLAACMAVAIAIACARLVPGACAWLLDAEAVCAFVAAHAVASRVVLVGINMLQVVLAFLPGEPVELASGYAFGFWEGTALCLLASAAATALIFVVVRRWGWRVVGLFFSRADAERFVWMRHTRRMELAMLAVFLIPGTPKDFLTYFAGLTRMRFGAVVAIATFGRLPSIVTSTLAASAMGEGNYALAAIALGVAGALLLGGTLLFRHLSSQATASPAAVTTRCCRAERQR